jgi:hypothetical protein
MESACHPNYTGGILVPGQPGEKKKKDIISIEGRQKCKEVIDKRCQGSEPVNLVDFMT